MGEGIFTSDIDNDERGVDCGINIGNCEFFILHSKIAVATVSSLTGVKTLDTFTTG